MTYLRFGIHLLLILALNYWILSFFFYRKLKRAVPHLEKLELPLPPKPPLVSVIMPACNEADHLELAVLSRLKSDYPNAEFILVDDRSTAVSYTHMTLPTIHSVLFPVDAVSFN